MKRGIDHVGVTVCFYCHDGKGKLLLHKRSDKCRDEQGNWDCGGGSMEFGETFEQAVRRELMEEYCVAPKKLTFVGANNVLRTNGKEKTHWVALVFSVLVDPKKVKIGDSEKMAEIGWFTIDKLPSPLHSMYLTHLKMVQKLK